MNSYINKKRIYVDFNRKSKWLGIIDYKTLTLIGIYICILLFIFTKIDVLFEIKVYLFFILCIPICAIFILSDVKQDSVFDMFVTILRYFLKKSIYVKEIKLYKFNKKVVYKI